MNSDSRVSREREIFLAALEYAYPLDRVGYLELVCEGDKSMLERLYCLFDSTEEGSLLFAVSDPFSELRREIGVSEEAGTVIGNYRLVEMLGEGSFGSVWRASQERPVRRDVALKILKLGMDTREILARFDQERQALAMMDHPNIAKVHDAGTTPSGRPFFAMELIEGGRDIADYCDQESLSISKRIALFQTVCRTVQHAHRKGVIHRDLKPSNILVSGGELHEVKVIDFGIAKAREEKFFTDLTINTMVNAPIGTPAYMSPEQFMGKGDIDTRTDVYSLGVLLYELLTGLNPFASDEGGSDYHEVVARKISGQIPKKPSTRVRSIPNRELSESRAELRGDLDCIVLKALEPEPDRRYESPGAFADDLERFLKNEPVLARPHSKWYLAKLLARRHRGAVIGGAAVLIALAIGFTVSSISLVREKRARELADREVVRSRKVSEILNNTLSSAGVSFSLGRDATMLKEILHKTAEGIQNELALQPDIEAEIQLILGRTFEDLTDYENAGIHLSRAVELRRNLILEDGSQDLKLLGQAVYELAENTLSRGNTQEAESLGREAIEIFELCEWKDEHAKKVKITQIESLIGWTMFRTGRGEEAEEMMRSGYGFWLKNSELQDLYNIPKTFGTLLLRIGKSPEAETVFRKELEQFRVNYGVEHPVVCESLANFSTILIANGKLDEAEECLQESLQQGRKFFGDRNPHGDHAMGHLATIAARRGDPEKELKLRWEAYDSCKRTYPENSVHRKGPIASLVGTLFRQGELAVENGDKPVAIPLLTSLEDLGKNDPEAKVDMERLKKLQTKLGN